MFCSRCGAQNADDARFCYHCGQALPPAAPAPVITPPVVGIPPLPEAKTVHYAGFWRRFVALFIDGLILSVPSAILSALFIAPAFSSLSEEPDLTELIPILLPILIGARWIGIVISIIQWIYYAAFESSRYQATPGKMALGIIVTDLNGNRISFGRATGRFAGKVVSKLILYIGYMMAGWTPRKQALHDMMSDCLVVMK
jgi:uncharacterized RDD family membrane protein YckC